MTVTENLQKVRSEIAEAAKAAGRPAESVRLLAVSKTFPASDIAEAHAAGQVMFGENRVQELETKVPVLPPELEWHLIGHLQSNKAAKAAELAAWIHSVDSVRLLEKIAAASQKRTKILLEVNTSGEESKFGIRSWEELLPVAKAAAEASAKIEFKGLMTMAPLGADESTLHAVFARTREWKTKLESELGIVLPELSMGMSSDFRTAIAEGATIVRIGTAIFGGRTYPA